MKDDILAHLSDPGQLEKLYRNNKLIFEREFTILYPELTGNQLADFWYERLNYEKEEIDWGNGKELLFVLITVILAGTIAKLPAIFSISEEFFYSRNTGFIVFPALAAYFAWKNKLSVIKIASIAALTIIGVIFINALPDFEKSDTLILACIHLPVLLWFILGFAYVGKIQYNAEKSLDFLKYNGDLIVMIALICIAGGIMTGITIGLFQLIDLDIEKFYFEYVAVYGLAAVPVIGTALIQTNPHLVGKVSPVIAKIFSPLVLGMLVIYLVAMVYSGKDPYDDREFLLIFNALLVGVMAIIFFSVAESSKAAKSRLEIWILFLLSLVTILVNGVALLAILFRISEWGITPNRAAVLGANVLILINLLWITCQLVQVLHNRRSLNAVGRAIAFYLPIYGLWAIIVTFIFPLLFGLE